MLELQAEDCVSGVLQSSMSHEGLQLLCKLSVYALTQDDRGYLTSCSEEERKSEAVIHHEVLVKNDEG